MGWPKLKLSWHPHIGPLHFNFSNGRLNSVSWRRKRR